MLNPHKPRKTSSSSHIHRNELPYDLRLVAGTIVKYLSEADCDVPPPDGGIAAPAPAGGQPSQRAPAG